MKQPIKGFSKLNKQAKIEWLVSQYTSDPSASLDMLEGYWHNQPEVQKLHDEFIENTISNYYMPFGVAPNFLINGKMYAIPLAIEESSVVAAAAKAANFWLDRGGFQASVLSMVKVGHVHFIWEGKNVDALYRLFEANKDQFFTNTESITKNMRARGGGVLSLGLVDKTDLEPGYYQIEARFETCDSMGANFINSCLESFAQTLRDLAAANQAELGDAIRIASVEPYRAVTHNKGIMNGIDSVIIATGNDFRATEACAHAYAAKDGRYTSLTHAAIEGDEFHFWIELPLSLGTVGGITNLHPMVRFAHELLGYPSANALMQITAVAGLAQNFSAVRSLITSGIQKGHMKMHLLNILNQLEANDAEKEEIVAYFKDKVVSHSAAVEAFVRVRAQGQAQA